MNFLYKAAVVWVLSLIAAGPIPLALHVALCHGHGETHEHSDSGVCSHGHHDHGSHAGHSHAHYPQGEEQVALAAGAHDHECGVCQTLSQTASSNTVQYESNSQLVVHPFIVCSDDVYAEAVYTSYQVRGPPSALLV